jgi:membrane associated rhomboid family serine protease
LYLGAYLGLGMVTDLDVVLAGSPVPSMGASGAIMGIMGVFAVLYPRNEVLIYYLVWAGQRFTGIWHISSFFVIIAYLVLDLIKLRTEGLLATGLIAHLLGMFTGMLVTMFLVHYDLIKMERGEENLLQWMGWKT